MLPLVVYINTLGANDSVVYILSIQKHTWWDFPTFTSHCTPGIWNWSIKFKLLNLMSSFLHSLTLFLFLFMVYAIAAHSYVQYMKILLFRSISVSRNHSIPHNHIPYIPHDIILWRCKRRYVKCEDCECNGCWTFSWIYYVYRRYVK